MHTLHLGRRTVDAESATPGTTARAARGNPWLWLGGGMLLFFVVPFVGTDVLGLQPDLYYLIYFTIAVAWFAVFVSAHAAELRDLWRPHLGLSLAVGAVAGAALVAMVLNQTATEHPGGWRFAFEILWRGPVYGSVDALTLFVFPAAVAYLLMHGNREGARRKAGFAGLALLLSLLVSTSYHLGYPEYRDADLRSPLIGTIVANVPTALTGNPLGAVVTHSMVHTAAVVHQHDGGSTQMLPPKITTDYPSHGDSNLAAGLASFWLLATAGALTLLVRRRRAVRPRTPTTTGGRDGR